MPGRDKIHARCGLPWDEHETTGEPFHFPRCPDEGSFIEDPPAPDAPDGR